MGVLLIGFSSSLFVSAGKNASVEFPKKHEVVKNPLVLLKVFKSQKWLGAFHF